jgi:Rieske [2Fe-2S] domain
MERADELTAPPVIGKNYLVRCLKMDGLAASFYPGIEWMPIIGDLHEDSNIIDFNYWHYHIDFRFVPKDSFGLLTQHTLHPEKTGFHFSKVMIVKGENLNPKTNQSERDQVCHSASGLIEYRKLKCKRVMGEFPAMYPNLFKEPIEVRFMRKLQNAYKGCKLKKDHYCPHKRFNLSSIPANENGIIVCPGHGLAFDKETRKQIDRI